MHLRRCHEIPIHCVICFSEFGSKSERDMHIRQRSCQLREPKNWEAITDEQREKLKRRVNTKKTRREQWHDIFAILFPGEPLPPSPYVESLLSQELIALQDFITQEWPPIFDRLVEQRLPDELRAQVDLIRKFSHYLFEEAVESIFKRFEATRRTDSGYTGSNSKAPNSTDSEHAETEPCAPEAPLAPGAETGAWQGEVDQTQSGDLDLQEGILSRFPDEAVPDFDGLWGFEYV